MLIKADHTWRTVQCMLHITVGRDAGEVLPEASARPLLRALGATDEFGVRATEMRVDSHDINATTLRLLGINHERLTFPFQGRDQRLTDVHGENEFTKQLFG